ncbi:MAG: 2Fe-2S iron-sulfur cluster-binding protein [Bacteroidota bacterium]|nr:2Fe-2S iron-sulfur cluster-binding protein [Bacteroidota bacterium]
MKSDIKISVIDRSGNEHQLSGPTDMNLNLMELLKMNEFPVDGTCGGMAMCASCHVYILSEHKLAEKSSEEMAMLDESWDSKDNSRLSCQLKLSTSLDGIQVELAPEQ